MTRPFSYCQYRGCKKFLKEDFDKWFITTDKIPMVYCEQHYYKKIEKIEKETKIRLK